MAKIQLVIDCEDTADFHNTLRNLLAGTAVAAALGTAGEAEYLPPVAEQSGEPGGPQRTRRTKAQIAADAQAAADNSNTLASATTASGASPGPAASSPAPSNTLSAQIQQAAAEVAADEAKADGALTEADVKAVMTAHMGKYSAVKTQAVLEAAVGVKRISEIPAEKYGEAIAALEAEL